MKYQGGFGCDDGNNIENDGCNKYCEIDTGFTCVYAGPYDKCTEICGDGYDYGNYGCDDGNLIPGDGCDQFCKVEPGWVCGGGSIPFPDICTMICSPAIKDFGIFACVDGNPTNLDGYFYSIIVIYV